MNYTSTQLVVTTHANKEKINKDCAKRIQRIVQNVLLQSYLDMA